ncbi:MAG: ATP-binding protein [Bacteroidetes bacterium]|nr:ATP-binding protein [Bacteroidota bacterium]
MERQKLYEVLFDQQKEFVTPADLVQRDAEDDLETLLKAKMPILITGVRRCGKSTLLKLLKMRLKLRNTEAMYVNFNDERLVGFSTDNFQMINDYLQEQKYDSRAILFMDEIQETTNWEKWVDRIKDKRRVIITGSNSKLLSSELSTIMTGRALTLRLYPFSFKEFLRARNVDASQIDIDRERQNDVRSALKEYLEFGGFPKRTLTNENVILAELYESILYKDIVSKFGPRQVRSIKEMVHYVISNISKQLSTRTLSEVSAIKNLGTIKRILERLEEAFLVMTVPKYDYSLRKQIQNPKKAYCVDNGIVTTSGFRFSDNKGQLLENAVFVELKHRGHEIYYHSGKKECDFVTKAGTRITEAMQVSYELTDENKDREIKGLVEALDKYKLSQGTIITFDQEEIISTGRKKVNVVPAWKWLIK